MNFFFFFNIHMFPLVKWITSLCQGAAALNRPANVEDLCGPGERERRMSRWIKVKDRAEERETRENSLRLAWTRQISRLCGVFFLCGILFILASKSTFNCFCDFSGGWILVSNPSLVNNCSVYCTVFAFVIKVWLFLHTSLKFIEKNSEFSGVEATTVVIGR